MKKATIGALLLGLALVSTNTHAMKKTIETVPAEEVLKPVEIVVEKPSDAHRACISPETKRTWLATQLSNLASRAKKKTIQNYDFWRDSSALAGMALVTIPFYTNTTFTTGLKLFTVFFGIALFMHMIKKTYLFASSSYNKICTEFTNRLMPLVKKASFTPGHDIEGAQPGLVKVDLNETIIDMGILKKTN